jgi:allophanate hydrolase
MIERTAGVVPGVLRRPSTPPTPPTAADGTIDLAVVGAHLSGQPLNGQLIDRAGRLVARTATSARYRLYALSGTVPPKPGLVRVDEGGHPIEVEVWRTQVEAFGSFVDAVPAPLAIGSVELADGRWVNGFVCEPWGIDGAVDITHHGGWRAYLGSIAS